jgi:hypothetical protein
MVRERLPNKRLNPDNPHLEPCAGVGRNATVGRYRYKGVQSSRTAVAKRHKLDALRGDRWEAG